MSKKRNVPFFDARGRLLIERRGLPGSLGDTISKDLYHFMRTATWTRITLLFAGLFVASNLVFAAVLYFGGANVTNASGFGDDFWFSVQTMGTIGYGVLAPNDAFANTIVAIECFFGIALTAMITGVFFSRFATAEARVIFSKACVVHTFDGERTLMFRICNARATSIFEANLRLYLSRDELTVEGERVRRIHDLALKRNNTPIFALSWSVYHVLDKTSPLYGITNESLASDTSNLIVTFQGTDDRLAATVHTRYGYNPTDIMIGHKFADIIKLDPETNVRYLDYADFDVTLPIVSPGSPA